MPIDRCNCIGARNDGKAVLREYHEPECAYRLYMEKKGRFLPEYGAKLCPPSRQRPRRQPSPKRKPRLPPTFWERLQDPLF